MASPEESSSPRVRRDRSSPVARPRLPARFLQAYRGREFPLSPTMATIDEVERLSLRGGESETSDEEEYVSPVPLIAMPIIRDEYVGVRGGHQLYKDVRAAWLALVHDMVPQDDFENLLRHVGHSDYFRGIISWALPSLGHYSQARYSYAERTAEAGVQYAALVHAIQQLELETEGPWTDRALSMVPYPPPAGRLPKSMSMSLEDLRARRWAREHRRPRLASVSRGEDNDDNDDDEDDDAGDENDGNRRVSLLAILRSGSSERSGSRTRGRLIPRAPIRLDPVRSSPARAGSRNSNRRMTMVDFLQEVSPEDSESRGQRESLFETPRPAPMTRVSETSPEIARLNRLSLTSLVGLPEQFASEPTAVDQTPADHAPGNFSTGRRLSDPFAPDPSMDLSTSPRETSAQTLARWHAGLPSFMSPPPHDSADLSPAPLTPTPPRAASGLGINTPQRSNPANDTSTADAAKRANWVKMQLRSIFIHGRRCGVVRKFDLTSDLQAYRPEAARELRRQLEALVEELEIERLFEYVADVERRSLWELEVLVIDTDDIVSEGVSRVVSPQAEAAFAASSPVAASHASAPPAPVRPAPPLPVMPDPAPSTSVLPLFISPTARERARWSTDTHPFIGVWPTTAPAAASPAAVPPAAVPPAAVSPTFNYQDRLRHLVDEEQARTRR